jgi:type I restriction enzyme M protein
VKSGAGQYFTPRALIAAMVDVVDPEPDETICDPACGTGGFLLWAYEHMKGKPGAADRKAALRLRHEGFRGYDIVADVVRLCAMNLYLHGIGGAKSPVEQRDSLLSDTGERFDIVLANPPFGKRQSFRIVNQEGDIESERQDYVREDFTVTTSNKQLNFLQHFMTIMKPGGTAAVVMPDNVLFEGGAGDALRRRLLKDFDFHTLLRLPTGIFYKQGVKANVLFFEKVAGGERVATEALWVYDLRTNQSFTLRERPLVRADLDDFVASFKSGRRHERKEAERFHRFASTSPSATSSTSTSSGSRTPATSTPTACRRPTRSRPRSSRTWRSRWRSSGKSRLNSPREQFPPSQPPSLPLSPSACASGR